METLTFEQIRATVSGYIMPDKSVRKYSVRLDTFDTKDNSFDAVIATESAVLMFDMRRFEVIREILLMSGVQIPESKQVPLLDSHDSTTITKVLGSSRNIRVEGTELVATNVISKAHPDEATKVREGHVTDNSIGYFVTKFVDIEPETTVEIGGKEFTADQFPLRISIEWQVLEDSLVPMGADDLAKNRSKYNEHLERTKEMDEQKKKDAQAVTPEKPVKDAPEDGVTLEARAENVKPSTEEIKERDMVALHSQIRSIAPESLKDVAEKCIMDGDDLEASRKKFQDAYAERKEAVGTSEPEDVDAGNSEAPSKEDPKTRQKGLKEALKG